MNERQTLLVRDIERLAQSLFDSGRTGDAQLLSDAVNELVRLARLAAADYSSPLLSK